MKIEQIYTGCLSQGAYYIVSGNEAAIIDPLRDIEPYMLRAEKDKVEIKYVFETHFHADFVSGHIDLARETGARVIYGPTAKPLFPAYIAHDGEEFKLGDITIVAIHTPGHTMESTCYLLKNEQGKMVALFSGDTLLIGDVGRPDLAQKATGLTMAQLAGLLYESLKTKILPLPDDVILFPGHGAGSACGKNIGTDKTDTLGHQKQFNYALQKDLTKEEFIKQITEGLLPPPGYFPLNAKMNKEGYENISDIIKKGSNSLSANAFEELANSTGALILDTRNPEEFVKEFIPKSINIGLNGSFAPWVGALIRDIKQPILFISDPGLEEEVIKRLSRVGYDNVLGYLEGGIRTWKQNNRHTDIIECVRPENFVKWYKTDNFPVIDVRKQSEYQQGHVNKSINLPLDYINMNISSYPTDYPFYIYCAGGYRSVIACSILKARGFNNMMNIEGGMDAIKNCEIKIKMDQQFRTYS